MSVQDVFTDAVVYWTPTLAPNVSWQLDARLYPKSLRNGVSPVLQQAQIEYDYGNIKRRNAAQISYESRRQWFDQFIRITSVNATLDWSGVVKRTPEQLFGDYLGGPELGRQTLTVVGFDWYLSTRQIDRSFWYNVEGPAFHSPMPMGFNTGMGYQRDSASADKRNKDSRGNGFGREKRYLAHWTALDILNYLLVNEFPEIMPRGVELAPGAELFLTYTPIVPVEGRTIYQVLADLINPRHGLVWWIDWPNAGVNGEPLRFNVQSLATTAISLPTAGGDVVQIPANTDQRDVSGLGAEATIQIDPRRDRYRSQVIVRAARQRCVYTAAIDQQTLAPGWTDAQWQLYRDAGKDEDDYPTDPRQQAQFNDEIRESDLLSAVFSRFVVPDNWNGRLGNGFAVAQKTHPDTGSVLPVEDFAPASIRLFAELPYVAGLDYKTPSAPTGDVPDWAREEYARAFAFIDVSQQESESEEEQPYWRLVENVANRETNQLAGSRRLEVSYDFGIATGAPGILLRAQGGGQHALGLALWGADAAPTETKPELDHTTLHATLCAELSGWCDGAWPELETPAADRMIIHIGDRARYDMMAPGTCFAIRNGKQQIAEHTAAADGVLRDDRFICRQLARIAYEWYGQTRATATITTKLDSSAGVKLGTLIKKTGFLVPSVDVNAVVQTISYRFLDGKIDHKAGFTELDFASIAR